MHRSWFQVTNVPRGIVEKGQKDCDYLAKPNRKFMLHLKTWPLRVLLCQGSKIEECIFIFKSSKVLLLPSASNKESSGSNCRSLQQFSPRDVLGKLRDAPGRDFTQAVNVCATRLYVCTTRLYTAPARPDKAPRQLFRRGTLRAQHVAHLFDPFKLFKRLRSWTKLINKLLHHILKVFPYAFSVFETKS